MNDTARYAYEVNGIRVYQDPTFTVTKKHEIELSWLDRLTSWPWQPWKKTYEISITEADPLVHFSEVDGERRITGHPEAIEEMSRVILAKINAEKNI